MTSTVDLRVIKTTRALYNSFTELLTEKSLDDITINELCDKALVRRATFYNHYADKYAFFMNYLENLRQTISDNIDKLGKFEKPEDYYMNVFNVSYEMIKENKKLCLNVINSDIYQAIIYTSLEKFEQQIIECFKQNIKDGYKLPTHPEIMTQIFIGGMTESIRWQLSGKSSLTEEEFISYVHKMICAVFR